jgi:hypothetical protein
MGVLRTPISLPIELDPSKIIQTLTSGHPPEPEQRRN